MAAPIGNQFWKKRDKHGRDSLFASPDLLWDAACEYFEWCDDNPLIEVDFRGKDIERVEIPKMRAYTLQGLCLYLGCSRSSLYDLERSKDFSDIITRIRDVIYTQKFEGAAAGILNSNIIARDLGIGERLDIAGMFDPSKPIKVEFGKGNLNAPKKSK